jgi:hypothetical protein
MSSGIVLLLFAAFVVFQTTEGPLAQKLGLAKASS